MTSRSEKLRMPPLDRAKYGGAVIKNAAFSAVSDLLRRRKSEGWTQVQIAEAIGVDTGWLSRNLRGPANWTLETFGALVEALDGEAEVQVHALEDPLFQRPNYDAYAEYEWPGFGPKKSVREVDAPEQKAPASISGQSAEAENLNKVAVKDAAAGARPIALDRPARSIREGSTPWNSSPSNNPG